MAQPNGKISTPFPAPPGLDAAPGNGNASAEAAANSASGSTSPERQAIMLELQKSVMEELDAKVAEKMKDLMAKGNKMVKQAEQESQKQNALLLDELALCRKKQEALEAENQHLKTVINSMSHHLNLLGAYFNAKGASPTSLAAALATPPTTIADTSGSSSASASSTLQDSPSADSFSASSAFPPLPPVPDFPFAAASIAPATVGTPLSLAEALAADTTPATPVSLAGSLPPPGPKTFSFTLRKADGTGLGLNVSHQADDTELRVEGIRPEGAVEAWNRQCVGSTASEKAVLAGDRIISVNGVVNDPVKMLEECRDKQLLKLTVVRGEAAPKTALRAEASEFVPAGAAPGLPPVGEESGEEAQEATASKDDEKTTEC